MRAENALLAPQCISSSDFCVIIDQQLVPAMTKTLFPSTQPPTALGRDNASHLQLWHHPLSPSHLFPPVLSKLHPGGLTSHSPWRFTFLQYFHPSSGKLN